MVKDEKRVKEDKQMNKKSASNLQSPQKLKGFDLDNSDGFMCDMETGVCGPVNTDLSEGENK